MNVQTAGSVSVITAIRPGRCRRDVFDETTTVQWSEFHLLGTDHGKSWGFFALAGMIVAWPVGIGAAVVSTVFYAKRSGERPVTTHGRELAGAVRVPCPLMAARLPIHLVLSSGAIIDGETGDDGTFVFVLPDDVTKIVDVRADALESLGCQLPASCAQGDSNPR